MANSSFKLVNFRRNLMTRLVERGDEVVALAPPDEFTSEFAKLGVEYRALPMQATGTSPAEELRTFIHVIRAARDLRPDAMLGYTIKANIYGGIAARMASAKFVPNVTGLGSVFDTNGPRRWLIGLLYRLAFRSSPRIFFQNDADQTAFLREGLASERQAHLLPGSGVDLSQFEESPLPGSGDTVTFLLVARMLEDKGVRLFAKAAGELRRDFPSARFQLLGPLFEGKETSLSASDIAALEEQHGVEYLGSTQSVSSFLRRADCVVLPSYYREGTPRSLLEAGAMGRPIITTSIPGCRDVVEHGKTGFVCAPRDLASLVAGMRAFLEASDTERAEWGRASARKIRGSFDEQIVINAYLEALAQD